jgi:hypothetical protein
MNKTKTLTLLLIALCAAMAACSSGPNIPDGEWEATSDTLGSFLFNVSDDGTSIDIVRFIFVDFSCGGYTTNGEAFSSNRDPSSIVNGQFSISTTSAQYPFVISGEFESGNTFASGSWRVDQGGTTHCTGEWEAEPQE